jgi:hypothetical protein
MALCPNQYVKLLTTIQKDGKRNVDFPREGENIGYI